MRDDTGCGQRHFFGYCMDVIGQKKKNTNVNFFRQVAYLVIINKG